SAYIAYLEASFREIADKILITPRVECYASSYRRALRTKTREMEWVSQQNPLFSQYINPLKAYRSLAFISLQDRVTHSITQRVKVLVSEVSACKESDTRASLEQVKHVFRSFTLKISQEIEYCTGENEKTLKNAKEILKRE